jgi:hypothetical protein
MKTIEKQVEEIIHAPIYGHPSNEDSEKIERLEHIVIKLAEQIDILIMFKKDA